MAGQAPGFFVEELLSCSPRSIDPVVQGTFWPALRMQSMPNTQPSTQEIRAARKRANDRLKSRMAQKADAPKAVAEYYATQQAAIDRIGALREQRLALEKKAHPSGVKR
jgi:hypothetical protein